jgi:phage-related protein
MGIKPKYEIRFFKEDSGKQPVRVWLKGLSDEDKKQIGADLKTLQYRWPLGMPLVRPMGKGLHELRTKLDNRISRVFFMVEDKYIILLHGFIKKTEKTPQADLELAQARQKKIGQYGYA